MASIKPSSGSRKNISLDDVCFLMTIDIQKDELMQEVEILLPELVFCSVVSIGQKEFTASMQAGMKSELLLIVNYDEYEGQRVIEYNRALYSIYRTFVRDDGNIELYCEVRVGGG